MSVVDRLLGWVVRAATRRLRRRAGRGERAVASLLPGSGYGWPGGWSQARFEQVQHYRGWAYVAIKKRAETIAGLAPNVSIVSETEVREGDLRTAALRQRRRKALTPLSDDEELSPVPPSHPLRRLLKNPNGPDTAWAFWFKWSMNLDLTGNAYVWAVPNGMGVPVELWVLPSQWVFPVVLGKGERIVDYYEIRPYGTSPSGGRGALRLPPDEVIHFADPHPFNLIDGYSTLTACAEWLDLDEQVTRSQWAQFLNQCVPGLHIELSEEYVDPGPEEIDRLRKRIDERFQGSLKTGQTIITPPGAKLQGYTHAPKEMDYVQSSDQTRDKTLSAFGLGKEIVGQQPTGGELSWYAPMLLFCRFTVNPRLEWAGQVFTEKLARQFGEDLLVWWDDPTPNNPAQVNADLQADFAAGAITPNEWRAERGREPYKHGGDDPLIPSGTAPLPLNTGKEPEPTDVNALDGLAFAQQEADREAQKEAQAADHELQKESQAADHAENRQARAEDAAREASRPVGNGASPAKGPPFKSNGRKGVQR